MTSVLPPRTDVDEAHLIAWAAGYLAGAELPADEAYERGFRDALRAVAVNVAELNLLDPGWRETAEVAARERIAARAAVDTERVERRNAKLGLPAGYRYRGGAVDWGSGLPAGSACAWLRRQRAGASHFTSPREAS